MYTVYTDDKILYSPVLDREGFVIFGDGFYEEEMNKPGSFSFSIPVNNPRYSDIKPMQSIITVKNGNDIEWRGRVISVSKDFYGTKNVKCEGELGYLYDILISRYRRTATVKDYFSFILETYNSNCHDTRRFDITDKSFDPYCEFADETLTFDKNPYDWPRALDALTTNITDVFGGYLKILYRPNSRELVYMTSPDRSAKKTLQFGRNLLDLEENIDCNDVFTRLHIFGKVLSDGTSRLNVQTPSGGQFPNKYIDADKRAIDKFGIIERIMIFDEITNQRRLREKGIELLRAATSLPSSFSVKAIDLSGIDQSFSKYEVGDDVLVESFPHDFKANFVCTKARINIFDQSQSEYSFGMGTDSLTDRVAGTDRKIVATEKDVSNLRNGVTSE